MQCQDPLFDTARNHNNENVMKSGWSTKSGQTSEDEIATAVKYAVKD